MSAIDSSGWAVNPQRSWYDGSEFIHQELASSSITSINNFQAGWNSRTASNQLNQVGDTWVVTPATIFILLNGIDTSPSRSLLRFLRMATSSSLSIFKLLTTQSPYMKLKQGLTTSHQTCLFDTRFVAFGVRLATDGTEEDMARLRVLQDQIVITGGGDGEGFVGPDMERMMKVRGALMEGYNNHLSVAQEKHIEWNIKDVTNWEGLTMPTQALGDYRHVIPLRWPVYALNELQKAALATPRHTCAHPKSVDPRGYYSITVYGEDKFLMTNENNIVSTNQGLTTNEDGTHSPWSLVVKNVALMRLKTVLTTLQRLP
ncbi:hypothetical protein OK016_27625 [Vibrio chagasii]|nr:hypothetical protein [Vibrio chagasii]